MGSELLLNYGQVYHLLYNLYSYKYNIYVKLALRYIKNTSFVNQAYYNFLLLEVVISNFVSQPFSCQALH